MWCLINKETMWYIKQLDKYTGEIIYYIFDTFEQLEFHWATFEPIGYESLIKRVDLSLDF